MIRQIIFFCMLLAICACDQIGSGRVANLVDMTPALQIETDDPIDLSARNSEIVENILSFNKPVNFSHHQIISEPVIIKNIIYSCDTHGFVSAFSIKEQKQLWKTDIKGDHHKANKFFTGGITYNQGKLYITNNSKYLTVLDANNGVHEFRKEFSDIIKIKPILAPQNKLLIQTVNNKLYCIDIVHFKQIWLQETSAKMISTNNYVHPTIFDNKVIANFNNGDVLCLSLDDGKVVWKYSLIAREDISVPGLTPYNLSTQPIIFDDFIYLTTTNNKLIKIYLYTGLAVWSRTLHDVQSIAMHQDWLIITNNARQVALLDSENGNIHWVGNLILEKERGKKKVKVAKFLQPFVSQKEDVISINVVANNGQLYLFNLGNNEKPSIWPTEIIPIMKNVQYQWISCCSGKLHLISDRQMSQ